MRTISDFTTAKAGGAGLALSALNPKNVLLTVAAAARSPWSGSLRASRSQCCSVSFS
jgi:hypothetical protein